MYRTYLRVPSNFYRVCLHTASDNMTLALVPDQDNANLIAQLLSAHYGVRKGETIVVTPTVIRHTDDKAANKDMATQQTLASPAQPVQRSLS
ncbi:MAG: hypothetical protein Q7U91_02695 [Sideroxyarcus sp.]|nr:hypothetical protein [Sideroxyarcus sp.]